MTTDSSSYLSELHQHLARYFNVEEIQSLCFQLNIDYETIPGAEKPSIIRNLLLALGRRGTIPELITLVRQERPKADWPQVPDDFKLPTSLATEKPAVTANQYHIYGDEVQGDKVSGDKVGGDIITIGDILGSSGIAIGRRASANVRIRHGASNNELTKLFAPLLDEVARLDTTAVVQVQALKVEVGRGQYADDEKIANLIGDIAEAVPPVIGILTSLFEYSIVATSAGRATKYALKRIQK